MTAIDDDNRVFKLFKGRKCNIQIYLNLLSASIKNVSYYLGTILQCKRPLKLGTNFECQSDDFAIQFYLGDWDLNYGPPSLHIICI